MEKITAKQLFTGILLIAFLLRVSEFFTSLAYDEIWTLNNFIQLPVAKLLFDLSLPNNQPLNSILIKLMYALPLNVEFIRLPNLLAGIIAIVLAGYLAWRMAGKRCALWSMFFMAVNAPLTVYSAQARGYSLQVMFLLVFACGLVKLLEDQQTQKRSVGAASAVIFSALASVITLPTSVLYLAGTGLIIWNHYSWKRISARSILVLAAAVFFCSIYIFLNLNDLLAARKWGEAIGSVPGYFCWLWGVLYAIVPFTILPFTVYYLAKNRQHWWGYGIFALLLFGSAIFTNGGPVRVYLPLSVLFCITAAAGVAAIQDKLQLKQRQLLALIAVGLAAAVYFYQIRQWRFTDYYPVFAKESMLPANTLTVYPAADGYAVLWNSRGKAAEYYLSRAEQHSQLKELLILNSPGKINGTDQVYNEKTLPLGLDVPVENFAGIPAQRLHLKRLDQSGNNNMLPVIAICFSEDKKLFETFRALLYSPAADPMGILLLNCWFSAHTGNSSKKIYCGSWYIAPGAMGAAGWKQLLEFPAGNVTLYQLESLLQIP